MSVPPRTCAGCDAHLELDDRAGVWLDREGSSTCPGDLEDHNPRPTMGKAAAREVVRRRTNGYYVDGMRGLWQDCPLCEKGSPLRRVHTTRPFGLATDVKAHGAVVAALVEHLTEYHEDPR